MKMKIILLYLIIVILISSNVQAIEFKEELDILAKLNKLILNSAIETDRYQSYQWFRGVDDNMIKIDNGYRVYELNPIVAGKIKPEFDRLVDLGKNSADALLYLEDDVGRRLYLIITFIEVLNVIRNNAISERVGLKEYYMISYSFRF